MPQFCHANVGVGLQAVQRIREIVVAAVRRRFRKLVTQKISKKIQGYETYTSFNFPGTSRQIAIASAANNTAQSFGCLGGLHAGRAMHVVAHFATFGYGLRSSFAPRTPQEPMMEQQFRSATVNLGLYPVVTSQPSSTTLYQHVSYHIHSLFF